jgi:hypothetical protein
VSWVVRARDVTWGIRERPGVYASDSGYTRATWGIRERLGVYASDLGYTRATWGIRERFGVHASDSRYTHVLTTQPPYMHTCVRMNNEAYIEADITEETVTEWIRGLPPSVRLPFQVRVDTQASKCHIPLRMLARLGRDAQEENFGYVSCVACTLPIAKAHRIECCSKEHSMHVNCFVMTNLMLPNASRRLCVCSAFSDCRSRPIKLETDSTSIRMVKNQIMGNTTSNELYHMMQRESFVIDGYTCVPRGDVDLFRNCDRNCVMCGLSVSESYNVVFPCLDHAVHEHCYVYWRKLRDHMTCPPKAECPAAYFGHQKCSDLASYVL